MLCAVTDAAPTDDAPAAAALRPPRHRVSPRAVRYWTLRAALGWLVVIAAQAVWLGVAQADATLQAIALAATVVVAVAHAIGMPRWRYRIHRWEAAPEALYTQVGWFDQERRIAPMSRIQTVDTERGPLEQLLGLATVTVTTASAAGPLRIAGLDRETADALVHDLTLAARVGGDDAT